MKTIALALLLGLGMIMVGCGDKKKPVGSTRPTTSSATPPATPSTTPPKAP